MKRPIFPDYLADGVYLDSLSGVAGTAWPIGTPMMPVDNLADAFTIAAARGLRHFYILHGMFAIPSNISDYVFVGLKGDAEIDLNGQQMVNCTLENLGVSGANVAGSDIFIKDCVITGTLTLFNGPSTYLKNIVCSGILRVGADAADIIVDGGIFGLGSSLDYNNFETDCQLINVSGEISIKRMSDAASSLHIFGNGLNLKIWNTCTAGDILIFGDTKITDISVGATVEDYTNKARPEGAISINAIVASETNFLNLDGSVPGWATHYTIDDLVLKCANPGANTVNVRLYKLVNGVLINTQTFAITAANFATYFDINTMFGLKSLAGDNIKITVQATAGGPYAVTGSYAYRSA
jgi:hypothetical protein